MAGESSFIKVLDKAELAKRSLEAQMAYVTAFTRMQTFRRHMMQPFRWKKYQSGWCFWQEGFLHIRDALWQKPW